MIKALQLVGAVALLGGPLFYLLIWRQALAAAPAAARATLERAVAERVRTGVTWAFILIEVAGLAELLAIAIDLAGAGWLSARTLMLLVTVLFRSERGGYVLLRGLLAAFAWWSVARASRGGGALPAGPYRAAAAAGAGILATFSITGHAVAIPSERVAATLSDLLHFLAASVWGGGLLYFAALPWRELGGPERLPLVQATIRRFSRVGIASVAVLLGTGVLLSTRLFYGLVALFETAYGKYLVWKLILLAFILMVAKDNLLTIPHRLRQAAAGRDDPGAVVRSLRRNVLMEVGALVAAVLTAGLLSSESAQFRTPVPVTVTVRDMQYHPRELALPKGRPVRLILVNTDTVTHSLAIRAIPYDGPTSHVHDPGAASLGDLVLYAPPGQQNSVVFRALRFGRYEMLDIMQDFADRGLTGTAIVK